MKPLPLHFEDAQAALQHELDTRGYYPDSGEALIPMYLLREIYFAMLWAGDEITQLREDLHGSMGAVKALLTDDVSYLVGAAA